MRNPLDRLRQRRLRRKYMPRPRIQRAGTTAKLALFALVVIIIVGTVLELRARTAEAALQEYAELAARPPLELIATGGRNHRLVFLGDVAGAVLPKRLAADAIDTLATAYGLDAVGLEIDSDQQPWIDRYLESNPEDPAILLTHPRTLREAEGTANAYLELYRQVWRLNQQLGADRRIRIIALDLPGWPRERALSPGQTATQFGQRGTHMLETVRARVLERNPRARLFFFVDGLHVLKGSAQVRIGGTAPVAVPLLAGLFAEQSQREVYSILVDAAAARTVTPEVAHYQASRAFPVLRERRAGAARTFALPARAPLDVTQDMVRSAHKPGLAFEILPREYRLADLIDAYIVLEN
jgi:hypothetical protein